MTPKNQTITNRKPNEQNHHPPENKQTKQKRTTTKKAFKISPKLCIIKHISNTKKPICSEDGSASAPGGVLQKYKGEKKEKKKKWKKKGGLAVDDPRRTRSSCGDWSQLQEALGSPGSGVGAHRAPGTAQPSPALPRLPPSKTQREFK